jgi:hypothetical protein
MDFIDRIKQSWETLVKPYPIQISNPKNYSRDTASPGMSLTKYSLETPPNIQDLIHEIGPLPPYSIIIGGCDDHSHLFLDLTDPAPGSILIVGDDHSKRSRLLESILISSSLLNSPRRVRYALIAPDITGLDYLTQRSHCYKATATATDEAIDLIYELAEIADYRRNNQQTGSAIILAIDDLALLLTGMNEDMLEQFNWLVQVGPEVQIWTIATLDSKSVKDIDPVYINQFGTRLIGSVESVEVVNYLTGSTDNKPNNLIAGSQFSVQFNEDWVRFWIPAVEEVLA